MSPATSTAVLSAGAALAGVLISQAISIFQSFLDKRHKKHILLRRKFEQLTFCFQESLLFHTKAGSCRTIEKLLAENHSLPAMKAEALALLYFPTLAPILGTYRNCQVKYYETLLHAYDPSVPASAGAQAKVHNPRHLAAAEAALFRARDAVNDYFKVRVRLF